MSIAAGSVVSGKVGNGATVGAGDRLIDSGGAGDFWTVRATVTAGSEALGWVIVLATFVPVAVPGRGAVTPDFPLEPPRSAPLAHELASMRTMAKVTDMSGVVLADGHHSTAI